MINIITVRTVVLMKDERGSKWWEDESKNNLLTFYVREGHDLALTNNYYIIHQSPYYNITDENITKIINGEASPGLLMRYPHLL